MSQIIGLLTDFGTQDIYVGVMKGVMSTIAPSCQVIDITHEIRPQNVREGAFALMNSYRYFPKGTTFCVVVDPGVGSTRLPIAVRSGGYQFIAPDNGVLSYALMQTGQEYEAVALQNLDYQLEGVSYTFHGRDIFSPAAAYLASEKVPLDKFGDELQKVFSFPIPQLTYNNHRFVGEVMHIDHFGNIISSIGRFRWIDNYSMQFSGTWDADIEDLVVISEKAEVTIHSTVINNIAHAYHEAPRGAIMAQIDSNGFLEIGANQDNAAERLDVQVGDKVTLRLL